jgi:hypothetical protein
VFLPKEDDVLLPCFPLAHEVEKMVIFSRTNGFMKESLDMVDENIDTFIQTRRRGL